MTHAPIERGMWVYWECGPSDGEVVHPANVEHDGTYDGQTFWYEPEEDAYWIEGESIFPTRNAAIDAALAGVQRQLDRLNARVERLTALKCQPEEDA